MRRVRLQALALSCVMVFSLFSSGCGSKKKSGKDSKEYRQAEAMLDDFCAYFKRGKYDKLDKMIDGTSKELATLKEFQDSAAKDLLEAANNRIIYQIGDIKIDGDEAEADLTITYFDAKDLAKKIDSDSSYREIKSAINAAEEDEFQFTCDLTYDDDWMIDSGSVDEIAKELFSFLSRIGIEAPPTPVPTRAQTLTEFSSYWYDEDFNTVLAYNQSAKLIRFMVTFWEPCYGETITYEYSDANGNTFTETVIVDNGDDFVYCDWRPTNKIAPGWIACTVYDTNMTIITVGCIEIYEDGRTIPEQIYILGSHMIDKDGIAVPGYHQGDTYIAAETQIDHAAPGTMLSYTYYKKTGSLVDEAIGEGAIDASSTRLILPLENTKDLEPGDYYIVIYDAQSAQIWQSDFEILYSGKEFTPDMPSTKYYVDGWSMQYMIYDVQYEIPKGTQKIYYYFETLDYVIYMPFTYELTDGKGKKIKEGPCTMVYSDESWIEIDIPSKINGSLTIKIFNPDGTLLRESTIQEET